MAREREYQLDMAGFEAAMADQRERARASWKGGLTESAAQVYQDLQTSGKTTEFLGYDRCTSPAQVRALVVDGRQVETLASGETGEVVLDCTPLYAEAGGQVGEHGEILWEDGRADVLQSTAPVPGLITHQVTLREGTLKVGSSVEVRCLPEERLATRRNHTATHLLHAALKQVLGVHVKQAGSLVAPDRLRFDFTHYQPLTAARLREIEELVNERIVDNAPVTTRVQPLEEALAGGAMALFGEKYGETVRVVEVPGFSTELCGGLHCRAYLGRCTAPGGSDRKRSFAPLLSG
jgi:alanyl-tRNA synthetase